MTQSTQISTPTTPPPADDPIVGIDLGTTNSLVAWCDEAGPRIIPDGHGRAILPSVVRFNPRTGAVDAVGQEARDHAVHHPRETIFSIKRLMGRGLADVQSELAYLPCKVVAGENDTARVHIGEHVISPQQVSAVILRELKHRADTFFGRPVRRAVITVPAYFDDAQRQATRDAGRIAGLDVLRIVNEPTAAALAYNLDQHHADATVAVFDLGGGTFDVSILRLQHAPAEKLPLADFQLPIGKTDSSTSQIPNPKAQSSSASSIDQVLSTAGDTHLGGDDVDRMLIDLIQNEIRVEFGAELTFPAATMQALRTLAEAAKIRLSSETSALIEIAVGSNHVYRRTLTRAEFETIIGPWVEKAIACCRRALKAAKLAPADINRVVMVGGSTRIPLVRRRVAEVFGSEPYTAINPDEVVALGAAVQASILAGINRDMLLLDVIPLSLGIETMGGAVAKIIAANTTIPARARENFSTFAEGQTSVMIHVLQGERELVKDCRSLGRFELKGIPPMPAGLPKIEVTFLVDANGILNVSAVEKRSEKSASIQIVPNHGLTRDEVRQIEAQSFAHAREDMTAHRLIDLRNQARLDIRAIERQLAKVGSDLDGTYRAEVEAKVAAVKAFIDAPEPDAEAFATALTAMDHATVHLAEVAIKKTLQAEGLGG